MTTRRKKIVERLNGSGTVYQEDSPAAKVRYALVVSQDMLAIQTFGGTSQMDGQTSAEGLLSIIEGDVWLMNTRDPLVLELEDSRRMNFFPVNHDPVANSYRIRAGGWLDDRMAG